MPRSKSTTAKHASKKQSQTTARRGTMKVTVPKVMRFPLLEIGREARRAKLRVSLEAAAIFAIEGNISRAAAFDQFDDLLVQVAVRQFPQDLHLAALLLGVSDSFVKKRWEGLANNPAEEVNVRR